MRLSSVCAAVSLADVSKAAVAVLGAVAVAVALGLSIYNFRESRKHQRVAGLSARLESHQPAPCGDQTFDQYRVLAHLSGTKFQRLVITNYGPATATDVELELPLNENGFPFRHISEHLFPVRELHVREEIHTELLSADSDGNPMSATLRWTDGRPGRQERTVWLSNQQIV